MSEKSNRLFWILLLLAAFSVRFGVAFYWDAKVIQTGAPDGQRFGSNTDPAHNSMPISFFFGDSDSYWNLGRAIAYGRPYEFDQERHWQIFRTPGYPAVLAPLFWIFGDNPPTIIARIQGVFFGVLNVALVGVLASCLLVFPSPSRIPIARLASVVVAFEPTLVFQSVLILSEESFLTFALLQSIIAIKLAQTLGIIPFPVRDMSVFAKEPIYIEWRSPQKVTWSRLFLLATLLGVTTAGAIYLRPSWYYFLPFATVMVLAFRLYAGTAHELEDYHYTRYEIFFSWKKVIFSTIATTFFVFLTLSPWIARNYRLTERFIPTTLQMGASLYDGLNPSATGASDMRFVDDFRQAEIAEPSGSANDHFEVRLDKRIKNASIEWAQTHPKEVIKLAFVKIYRLWAPFPREKAFAKPFFQIALFTSFTPIFILGLIGGFVSWRRKGAAWILLIPAIYVTALHSIFVSSIRYRTPIMFGFAILAAYSAMMLVSKIRKNV